MSRMKERSRRVERDTDRRDEAVKMIRHAAEPLGLEIFEGELLGTLTAATNGKTGMTTVTAKEWVYNPSSMTDPQAMMLGTAVFLLVNRSLNLSGSAGTYCVWMRIKSEYRIIWIDC